MGKLTPEEIRVLRKQVHGIGQLAKMGLIAVTDAGRQFISKDDERVRRERAEGGTAGGRPATKKGGKQ